MKQRESYLEDYCERIKMPAFRTDNPCSAEMKRKYKK